MPHSPTTLARLCWSFLGHPDAMRNIKTCARGLCGWCCVGCVDFSGCGFRGRGVKVGGGWSLFGEMFD